MLRLLVFFLALTLITRVSAVNVAHKHQEQTAQKETIKLSKKQTKKYRKILRKTKQKYQLNFISAFGLIGMILGIGLAVLAWVYSILFLKILAILVLVLAGFILTIGLALGSGDIQFC